MSGSWSTAPATRCGHGLEIWRLRSRPPRPSVWMATENPSAVQHGSRRVKPSSPLGTCFGGTDAARSVHIASSRHAWGECQSHAGVAPDLFVSRKPGSGAAPGKTFAIGGNTSQGNVAQAEAYDPATNAWTVLPSLPDPRNHVMGFVAGGEACMAGGRSPTTARVDCFDVATGGWGRLPDLPQASSGGGATTFIGGDVVVMGGQDASETRIVDQLTRHIPGGGWSSGERMLLPRHGFELAIFAGRAWACGGGSAPGLHPVATCTSIAGPSAAPRGR